MQAEDATGDGTTNANHVSALALLALGGGGHQPPPEEDAAPPPAAEDDAAVDGAAVAVIDLSDYDQAPQVSDLDDGVVSRVLESIDFTKAITFCSRAAAVIRRFRPRGSPMFCSSKGMGWSNRRRACKSFLTGVSC